MDNLRKYLKPLLFFLAIVLVGFATVAITGSLGRGVPRAFSEARLQGAMIAQNIVDVSNRSVQDLGRINELDKQGNFTEALNLTTAAVGQSQEIRNEAIRLSTELEKMTLALSEMKSFEARQAAFSAVSNHLALISRLINYSGYLGRLLEVLRHRFTGDFSDAERVDALISQINSEIEAINKLNTEANEAISKFDKLVR